MSSAKLSLVAVALLASVARAAAPPSGASADLDAARALFRRNLDAIRHHDRAAYLACYWHSERLARTGPTGFIASFDSLERATDEQWPEVFEAMDLRVTPVQDGVVYGTYRYRVRFSGEESSGISERLFVRTQDGWRIAVTTAFANAAGIPAP